MENKAMYKMALMSQGAVNVGALVRDLANYIDLMWDEARLLGEGTDYVNNHPVMRLFIEQMNYQCKTDYFKAYEVCERKSL